MDTLWNKIKEGLIIYFQFKEPVMNELIQSLQQKVGLSGDQATGAVNHILDFIKSKLPESMHGLLDNAASGTGLTDELKSKAEGLLSSFTGKMNF